MPDADIGNGHLGHLGHAARSQLHRWYPLFERPAGGVDNALDILADDVVVSSGLGEARGPARYAERVAHIESVDVEVLGPMTPIPTDRDTVRSVRSA